MYISSKNTLHSIIVFIKTLKPWKQKVLENAAYAADKARSLQDILSLKN